MPSHLFFSHCPDQLWVNPVFFDIAEIRISVIHVSCIVREGMRTRACTCYRSLSDDVMLCYVMWKSPYLCRSQPRSAWQRTSNSWRKKRTPRNPRRSGSRCWKERSCGQTCRTGYLSATAPTSIQRKSATMTGWRTRLCHTPSRTAKHRQEVRSPVVYKRIPC